MARTRSSRMRIFRFWEKRMAELEDKESAALTLRMVHLVRAVFRLYAAMRLLR